MRAGCRLTSAFIFPLLLAIVRAKPPLTFRTRDWLQSRSHPREFKVALSAAVLGGGLILALAVYRKWNGAVCAAACTTAILLLIANRMIMPGLDSFISARPAAAGLLEHYQAKPDEIAFYHLPRAYAYGLDYYFGRELPEWTPENTRATYSYFPTKDSLSTAESVPLSV